MGLSERRLLLIEKVVHLPEPPLFGGRLRSTRNQVRAGMRTLIGKLTEDIGQALAERLTKPRQHKAQTPAIRTEIVAINEDADDALARAAAAHMVAGRIDGAQQLRRGGLTDHCARTSALAFRKDAQFSLCPQTANCAMAYCRTGTIYKPLRARSDTQGSLHAAGEGSWEKARF